MAKRKKFKEKESGAFQGHCACVFEDCGSSDAGSYYLHDDGSHSFSCFACEKGIPDFDISDMKAVVYNAKEINWEEEMEKLEEVRDGLVAVDFKERRLRDESYDFYGVKMDLEDDGETIKVVYYPTYRDGVHCGYRNRKRFQSWHDVVKKDPSKEGVLKDFTGGIGDTKKGIEMFGQHLFPSGGKRIIITCGEDDAVVTYEMTSMKTKFDGGYPTISTPSGENIAWIKPHLKYISSFDEIFIIADNDKKGKEFEAELCKVLPVGKVKLVRLPEQFKDPSALWTNNKGKGSSRQRQGAADILWQAIWNAEKYSPAGIMSLSEGWSKYMDRGKDTLIAFPDAFGELNAKTHGGAALGEIINIIAPSSVGKSSFVKETIYEALHSTNYNVGVISLEETIDEFIEGMLSVHMSTQLNEVSYDERDRKAEYAAFQGLLDIRPDDATEDERDIERIQFLDHQGACSGEELLEKIDFLIKGLDCKIIVLDPVTLACSGDTDEDDMASEIVKRVKRHNLLWINVHHVRKNQNGSKANSEGGDLSEEDIKGTGAWFQTGMINLIFTRNKIHDNPIIRNTTTIKMSKCRRHGKNTGIAGWIYYNGVNGRLEKGVNPAELEAEDEGFDNAGDDWG